MNGQGDLMNGLTPFSDLFCTLLGAGYSVRFRADGDSMWPTICSGNVVTAVPVDPSAVRPGDIVVCRSGPRWLVHRVAALQPSADGTGLSDLVLRGDAKRGCDAPLPLSAVVARVTTVERTGVIHSCEGRLAPFRDRVRSRLYRVAAASRTTATPWAA